uniref:non-specific serine/threonine protein kinase n=1 Tax=Kalanchoe fedtschenkoi TaxID=63787 RepID=A0A7N0REV1_KALFE
MMSLHLQGIRLLQQCFGVACMILISASGSCSLASGRSFSNETDRLALLDFKNHLADGGVACGSSHQRVISLTLDSQGLRGSLPPSIGNLTFLRSINFGYNNLGGTIPKEMGFLPRLQYLNLTDNVLSGHIPVELMNCSDLRVIHIGSNNLTGSIPFEVGHLSGLRSFMFEKNSLTGSIPSSIGYLSELQLLWLPSNNLSGSIPSSIGNLSSLRLLCLLSNLGRLRLYNNRLSGTIPASLYNLSSAIEISVADNNLHGDFMPDSALNVPNLISLIVGYNEFSGNFPAALLNISTLRVFDAPSNNLTGQIPSNLGVLENLRRFNVEYNELGSGASGDLEFLTSLGNASFLSILGLQNNQFGGELPASFFNGSIQLTRLTLGSNRISGSIPDAIGKQTNLLQLGMENNDLSGVIPESIGSLVALAKLDFNGNRLTGSIPDSLGNLTRAIPFTLNQLNLLQNLLLSQNKLTGKIPENFLNHFDQLIALDLHQNLLTGSLPSDIGKLKNLGDLSLFDNKLSGEIPVQLGECTGLEFLDMSGNYLEGRIPSSLKELRALQFLDLSRGVHEVPLVESGSIPTELENLSLMWHLNLSFNNFEGQVPTGGVFGNISGFSFEENGRLCGGISLLRLPRCTGRPRKTLSTIAIILIVIACAGFSALMIACVVLRRRRKMTRRSSLASLEVNGLLRVSYKDLHDATSGFDSSKLFGMGSIGSVYKGFLFEEQKPVAVKVLNLQKHGALKTFQAECQSLGTIRHRNILKILTVCSSIDDKGNEFLALVFELMPNGSLENWLHESRSLSFEQRLEAAIDIASALDYLHNGCEAPIVHCDLKPSNVLLDQDMVAHVGDFGLARVLFVAPSDGSGDQSSSYAVKGSIGYIPPEYGMGGKVSPRGDVYSFGILLLEMITGMRPTNNLFADGFGIHEFVKRALPDRASEIAYSNFAAECEISIGVACSLENPSERMAIADVLNALLVLKTKFLDMDGHQRRICTHQAVRIALEYSYNYVS